MKSQLISESNAMVKHALSLGIVIPEKISDTIEKLENKTIEKEKETSSWMYVHNKLSEIVAPAKPCSIFMLMSQREKKSYISSLGPVPIIQNFIIVMLMSLLFFILISLSSHINRENLSKSIFDLQGISLLANLFFILVSASLGASFSALYKANQYVISVTFEPKYDMTYWVRYFLGLVSGLLLAELISLGLVLDVTVNGQSYTFLKPLLALVGGFSATAVFRIMNTLVGIIEKLFKASSLKDENEIAQLNEQKVRNIIAGKEIEFANHLFDMETKINSNASLKDLQKVIREIKEKYISS